jgi:hypothetical protein
MDSLARIYLWKIPRQVFQMKNQTTPGLRNATQTDARSSLRYEAGVDLMRITPLNNLRLTIAECRFKI